MTSINKRIFVLIFIIIALSIAVFAVPSDNSYSWTGSWLNSTGGVAGIDTTITVLVDMGFGDGTCDCASTASIISASNGDWSTTTLAANFKWTGTGQSAFCGIGPFGSGNTCPTYLQANQIAYAYPDNPAGLLCNTSFSIIDNSSASFSCLQDEEIWTAEWFNCLNEKERKIVMTQANTDNSDDDSLNDFEERLWDLDPRNEDTDGDGLEEGNQIYSFVDPCPKHCNDYCEPKTADQWELVVCNETPYYDFVMIEDYLFKINHLSYIFNSEEMTKATYWIGLYSEWKYNDSNINFNDNWVNLTYDDSGWSSGNAYLGYDEFLISTNLSYGSDPQNKTVTYYFRNRFNMTNVSSITNITFNIDYDDGFVAYLNGHEISRSPGASTDHYTYVPYHESGIGNNPSNWLVYQLNSTERGYLIEGENGSAIEMHQCQHNSSDIVMGAYLVSYEDIPTKGLVDNITEMCSILSTNNTAEEALKRELMALWLNVVSANICYTYPINHGLDPECEAINSDTIDALLGYAENILINNVTSSYPNVSYHLELINTGICIDCAACLPPPYINISLHWQDNKSVDIEWGEVWLADYYRIYYSNNLTVMRDLDLDNPPPYVFQVDVDGLNWTDFNASQDIVRFYRVATICPDASKRVIRKIAGKQTYNLVASKPVCILPD